MSDFKVFQAAVAARFKKMVDGELPLFVVGPQPGEEGADYDEARAKFRDQLWETYIGAFPDGTNPVYKTRTENDCSCCRAFVKTMGGVVGIHEGRVKTIWDLMAEQVDSHYSVVAKTMADFVRSQPIMNVFRHDTPRVGTISTPQMLEDKRTVITWDHFYLNLPASMVAPKADIPTRLSAFRSTFDVFKRGLETISLDAVDTVLELIAQNSIYRGEEMKFQVAGFRSFLAKYVRIEDARQRDLFVWSNIYTPEAIAKIRGTAIGQLLLDITDGKELEDSVKSFETMVGAANYKRPTALVTKKQVEEARAKVRELGLETALERRYAHVDDVDAANLLFVDRSASAAVVRDAFDQVSDAVATDVKKLGRVEEIGVEDFVRKVLPSAKTVEVLFENRHAGNMVSLITAVDPTARRLFKWGNPFSWSYTGDLADSIKERVKKAGGSVVGDLCCRLAWNYADDLDFHMHEPGGGHIFYGTYLRNHSPCGGVLDLDANGRDGVRTDPAENIVYADRNRMREGQYKLSVHNYARRTEERGFEVEIEMLDGQLTHIAYEKALRQNESVQVATISYSRKDGFKIVESLPSSSVSKMVWGLPTQTWVKAQVVMMSPNHWDGEAGIGNRHFFFMLDKCVNEGVARGFFNEQLASELDKHRKVMEMVGARMKTEESERQLSGVGFSSTMRNSVLVRVTGSFTRVVKVNF